MKDLFAARQVPVIDVAGLVEAMPVSARIVNGHDAHPSARVHALVAEAIGVVLAER